MSSHQDHVGTSSSSSSGLASTGVQIATASLIVVVLLGAGTVFLVAGRRRRHT